MEKLVKIPRNELGTKALKITIVTLTIKNTWMFLSDFAESISKIVK